MINVTHGRISRMDGSRHKTKKVLLCWNLEASGVVGPETDRQAFDTKWQDVTANVRPSFRTWFAAATTIDS
jgi:hypothetical protein